MLTKSHTLGRLGPVKRFAWLLWPMLLLALACGVARLRFDTEILNLLPGDLEVTQGLKLFQRHFSDAGELVITVEAPTEQEAATVARRVAESLRTQTNLVSAAYWQPVWLENPMEAADWVAYLWLNQPPAVFADLIHGLAATNLPHLLADTLKTLTISLSPLEVARHSYDPYGLTRLPASVTGEALKVGTGDEMFVAADGKFRLIFVSARPDLERYTACRSWLSEIQQQIGQARTRGQIPPGAEVHFTGRPVFVSEISGGMERDLGGTASGTLTVIGLLFWLTHRRVRPMLWLLFLLLCLLGGTIALGGLFFGAINVVSMGFAAILMGLAEDFGIVLYQESRSHPELNARELRQQVAPGIIWSAVTTAGAFLLLNLSSLPGIGQLGSLVALGIIMAVPIMLFGYLPPLLGLRRIQDRKPAVQVTERFLLFNPRRPPSPRSAWMLTAGVLALGIAMLVGKGWSFDGSANPLRPKQSEAAETLERIKNRFARGSERLWVLISGEDEAAVAQGLMRAQAALRNAASNQLIANFTLPLSIWPQSEHQRANCTAASALLQRRADLRNAAVEVGFKTNALVLTERILDLWQRAGSTTDVFWPTNAGSRWLLGKVAARSPNGLVALGLIQPQLDEARTRQFVAGWPKEWHQQGILLSGWVLLGSTVFDLVVSELPRLLIPILLLVLVALWLAFRNLKEVSLSLATLAFSGVCLGATMNILGWEWNILNLMALPLLLGLGVDFSLHIQLALRRCGGDVMEVHRSVGRALLLAGSTTVAGFGSLAFSTNAGMASLGKVCAAGIALALLTAVYLLPVWWKASISTTATRARQAT
jgi:predicted RND superfamily exporter protein